MTAGAVPAVELDPQTIAELESLLSRPGRCEYTNDRGGAELAGCPDEPRYLIRYELACACGNAGVWLLCTAHARRVLSHLDHWCCSECGHKGRPRRVSWEPL